MRVTKAIKAEQLRILRELYPNAKPALTFKTPFELLIAVILSAQCTDVRVNVVTGRQRWCARWSALSPLRHNEMPLFYDGKD